MRQLCLQFDWINNFQQLASRFKSNDHLHAKINAFFDVINNSSSIDNVLMHFIEYLNQISKSSSSIKSSSSSYLYIWVVAQNQDSRVYGPRNYRMYGTDLVFRSDLTVNVIHALISVIFINTVYSRNFNGEYVPLTVGGMFESSVFFDAHSPRITETYFSKIISFLNSDSSGTSSSSSRKNYNKRSNNSNYTSSSRGTSVSNSSTKHFGGQENPHPGVRSFSSVNNSNKYLLEITRNNEKYVVSFPSLDELKLFFRSEVLRS